MQLIGGNLFKSWSRCNDVASPNGNVQANWDTLGKSRKQTLNGIDHCVMHTNGV